MIATFCWDITILHDFSQFYINNYLYYLINKHLQFIIFNNAIIYLLLANFFIVVNSGLTIPWFIKKKLVSRGISNLIGLAVIVTSLCYFWFILHKQDISSIAFSVTFGYLFYFIYMLIIVGKELWSIKEVASILTIILFAAVWTFVIILMGYSYTLEGLSFYKDVLRSCIIGIITFIAILPVTLIGLRLSDYRRFMRILD